MSNYLYLMLVGLSQPISGYYDQTNIEKINLYIYTLIYMYQVYLQFNHGFAFYCENGEYWSFNLALHNDIQPNVVL